VADNDRNPFGDARYVDPTLGQSQSSQMVAFVGAQSYVEDAGRPSTAIGASVRQGRHVVLVEDAGIGVSPVGAPGVGRYLELYTLGDSDLPALTFHPSGRKLAGLPNTDLPDFASYKGFVGMVDGAGRTFTGGAGRALQQFAHPLSSGQSRVKSVIGFDGTATFQNKFPYIGSILSGNLFVGQAVGAAAYFGLNEPFGRIRLYAQNLSSFTGTVVWEYWDGGTWTALSNVTDDTASFNNPTLAFGPPLFVSFSIPGDWATTSVNSVGPHYYVRARMTVNAGGPPANFAFGDHLSRLLRGNDDLYDGTAALQKVGDTVYWGDAATFSLLRLAHNDGSAGSLTVAWEYWDGAAWTALPGLTDGTSAFSAATTPQDVTFTIPGDWAARTLIIGDGLVTDSLFFMRARLTAVATPIALTSPTVTANTVPTGTEEGAAPVAYDIGVDPTVRAPEVIGWGIALPPGVVADPTGLYTYWDPIRQIHSRRFDPAATGNYIPAHGESAVTEVAQWTDAFSTATLVGTGALGALLNIDTSTADATITIGVDAGPPVFYDESKPQAERDFSLQGYTACVLRNRAYVARGDRVLWCERGDFHAWAPANGLDIAPNDGDEIVAIHAFADKVFVFKRHHIYALAGEPSVGTTGIQVVEYSNNQGCVAKRSIVDVGAQLLFLSQSGVQQMDTNGVVQPLEVSEPVNHIFGYVMENYAPSIHQACAAWEPTKHLYLLAMPGVQEQTTGGASPAGDVGVPAGNVGIPRNDGIMAYCRRNGQWAMWPFSPGQSAGSLVTYWPSSNTRGVLLATNYGRLLTLTEQPRITVASDVLGDYRDADLGSFAGTATSASVIGDELIDTGAAWVDGTADRRLLGLSVWIVSGRAAGQFRMIFASTATTLFVGTNWNPLVGAGDRYVIGAIYWHADTGDLVWSSPTMERVISTARPIFNGNPFRQTVDFAVDVDSVDETTNTFRYGGSTVRVPTGGGTPSQVALPQHRGSTMRIRMSGRIGAGAANKVGEGKTRVKHLLLAGKTFGRAGDI
jgi:hypothetical protein